MSEKRKVTIIAEAGVNHNGDFDRALEMIDVAAEAGVDFSGDVQTIWGAGAPWTDSDNSEHCYYYFFHMDLKSC